MMPVSPGRFELLIMRTGNEHLVRHRRGQKPVDAPKIIARLSVVGLLYRAHLSPDAEKAPAVATGLGIFDPQDDHFSCFDCAELSEQRYDERRRGFLRAGLLDVATGAVLDLTGFYYPSSEAWLQDQRCDLEIDRQIHGYLFETDGENPDLPERPEPLDPDTDQSEITFD